MLSNLIIFLLLFLVSCQNATVPLSPVMKLILVVLGLFVLFVVVAINVAKARVRRIQRIYKATKSQLHFWDKLDRRRLESFLMQNELPQNWVFKLNHDKNKIESIHQYLGLEVSKIAQDKELLYAELRSKLPKR